MCGTTGGFRIMHNFFGMDQGNAISIPNQIMETCFGENRMEIPTPQNKWCMKGGFLVHFYVA